jgi:hypothetical protein
MDVDHKSGHTKPEHHPIARVEWRDPKTLKANDYNPNRVFPPELALLKRSILEDGWTTAIVIRADGEVVDGFHRWTVSHDPEVAALTGGLVPCVVMPPQNMAHQMMSTVRHNRARGAHGLLKMADITRNVLAQGYTEEQVCAGMGMELEELDRLTDLRGSPDSAGKDSFGQGWVPDPIKKTEAAWRGGRKVAKKKPGAAPVEGE